MLDGRGVQGFEGFGGFDSAVEELDERRGNGGDNTFLGQAEANGELDLRGLLN